MNIPIVCSLDSLIAAGAMAFAGVPERYQRRVTLGFMVCDMLAGMAGSSLGLTVSGALVIPAVLAASATLAYTRRWPWLCLIVPVLLSMDNLAMGAAEGPLSLASALLDGLWSGTLAWAGFAMARSAMSNMALRRAGRSV
jgi:hypothetical protein